MAKTRKRVTPAAPPDHDDQPEAAEEEVQEEVQDVPVPEGVLDFNKPLTWRAGRQIPVNDLHASLKELSTKLSRFQQGEVDRESVIPKAQELASASLLQHKDDGVKAWTLLCIVRVFHLLAPDAPYKSNQLRDIFVLFYSQIIPALADSSNPYHAQHIEILHSFAADKSVCLISDIKDSDKMFLQLFQNTFDVAADAISNNVLYQLKLLLIAIVDDAEGLPNEVVEVILAQFLRADPEVQDHDHVLSPAYDLARSVCDSSASRMSRYVTSYFSSVLIDTLTEPVEDSPRAKKRKTTEPLDDARRAHELLRELWRAAPDVVNGVIPSIEAELGTEKQWLRVMAVQTIGDMVSGIGAMGYDHESPLDPAAWPSQSLVTRQPSTMAAAPHAFASVHPACYQAFLDRHRDVDAHVRTSWCESVGRIIATDAGGRGLNHDQEAVLSQQLSNALRDRDDDVRLAAIDAISMCDFSTLARLLSSETDSTTLLSNLTARTKDTKPQVRQAAIELLGKIWGVAAGAIAEDGKNSAMIRSTFGPLASRVLDARYLNLPDVNNLIPDVLHTALLPTLFPPLKTVTEETGTYNPDAIRAERILVLVRDLEEKADAVFLGMQRLQKQKAKVLSHFLDTCEQQDKKDKDAKQRLEKLIEMLANQTETIHSVEHLTTFAASGDRRNTQLIRFCLAPESDYRKIVKAIKELTKRTKEAGQPIMETLLSIIQPAAPLIYNRSHVPIFMEYARTDDQGLGAAAKKLITEIATTSSDIFKIHIVDLCEALQRTQPTDTTPADDTAVDTLKACVGFARQFPGGMTKDRALYQALTAFATYGLPTAAKHAVTIIALCADKKEMYLGKLLSSSIEGFRYGGRHFLTRLATIAQLCLLANEQTVADVDAITTIAVRDILKEVRRPAEDSDPEWCVAEDDEDLSSKLLAIKILVNSLRGKPEASGDDRSSLKSVVDPVYKLLNTLIEREGEISKTAKTPQHHRAHLRLAAGLSLLKLSSSRTMDSFLTHVDCNRLARLCQDPVPEVRATFAKALKKYLGQNKLPSRFLVFLFLYAFEPVKETKQSVETWIKSRAAMSARRNDKADTAMEASFPRLLSLLIHHPDFGTTDEELQDAAEYIIFYLKNVATEANLPLIYNLAQRAKTVQDGIDSSKNEDLYAVSDLAETIIRAYQEEKGWTLQSLDGKLRLPAGLFRSLPSDVNAQAIAEKRYISEDMVDAIPDLVRAGLRVRKARTTRADQRPKTKPLADAPTKGNQKKRSSAEARREDDYDEDEHRSAKRAKKSASKTEDAGTRRRSSRNAEASKNYVEDESDDDDEELQRWNSELYSEANKENRAEDVEDTPPTSDPIEETTTKPSKPSKAAKTVKPSSDASVRRSSRRAAHVDDSEMT